MMKTGFTFFYALVLGFALVAPSTYCQAQVEVSSGIDMSYPLMINKYNQRLNYGQISFGIRLGVSYKPAGTQFFPTLNYTLGRTRMPLQQVGNNVACENFNYQNVMLNGNYVVTFNNQNSLYIIGGIGFSNLSRAGVTFSGKNGDASNVNVDSVANIDKIFPAIGLGLEYVYGDAVNQKLYMSLGLSFQYTIFFQDRNNYFLTIRDYNRQATLQYASGLYGRAITPTFYITLHYLMGKEIIFWKKHDSRYE